MVQKIIDTLLTSLSLSKDKRFNITHLHTVRSEATAIVTKVLKTSNDPFNASSILYDFFRDESARIPKVSNYISTAKVNREEMH